MTNKKSLEQQYLETKTRAGVYAIRNQITGRALVAGSTHVQGTLKRHQFELRYGRHRNAKLVLNWVQHGDSNFLFEVLDMVNPSEDPAFNAAQELAMLVRLWRQEIPRHGELGFCLALHRAHASRQLRLHNGLGTCRGISFNDFALLNLLAQADGGRVSIPELVHSLAVHPLSRREAGQPKYRSAPKTRAEKEHSKTTCHAQG